MSVLALPWFYHFDHIASGQSANYILGANGWDAIDNVSIDTQDSIRRAKLSRDAFGGGSWQIDLPSTYDLIVVGAMIRHNSSTDADGDIIMLRNGTTDEVGLDLSVGSLRVQVGGSIVETVATLNVNTDYYVELAAKSHATAGEYYVYIDGILVASATGLDTQSAGEFTNVYAARGGGSTGAVFYYAYMYLKEWDDSSTPGQYGPIVMHHVAPEDDVSVEWDATPGAGDNYEDVDEASIDDDTSYIETDVDAEVDEYTSEDAPGGLTTILAATRYAVAKIPSGGAPKIELGWKDGGDESYSSELTPSSAYRTQSHVFMTHPDGSAWTTTNFNSCSMLTRAALS